MKLGIPLVRSALCELNFVGDATNGSSLKLFRSKSLNVGMRTTVCMIRFFAMLSP